MNTTTTTTDTYELEGCTDCLMLIANGDTSGNSRCETEEGEASYLADVERQTGGLHLCPTSWPYDERQADDSDAWRVFTEPESFRLDEDGTGVVQYDWTEDDRYYGADVESRFTMNGCEICGSHLGGDRHAFAGWKIED